MTSNNDEVTKNKGKFCFLLIDNKCNLSYEYGKKNGYIFSAEKISFL